jgi:antitoxin component of RelBE/YafQ-DinJ toxin-antitoxin module
MVMKAAVQARLDAASRRDLEQLVQSFGWSPSKVVREALRRLASSHPLPGRPRIAGLGKFSSGVRDLGSNKKHLKGFGG